MIVRYLGSLWQADKLVCEHCKWGLVTRADWQHLAAIIHEQSIVPRIHMQMQTKTLLPPRAPVPDHRVATLDQQQPFRPSSSEPTAEQHSDSANTTQQPTNTAVFGSDQMAEGTWPAIDLGYGSAVRPAAPAVPATPATWAAADTQQTAAQSDGTSRAPGGVA
jgi:hypothetical protein